MIIRIDPQSSEPVFEQIAFAVKAAVAAGQGKAGDKLPSVRELARELAINPNTVVRAYELLERDRVIVRRQGAGCFLTGHGSDLAAPRRKEQLAEAVQRLVTDAFHLGFDADQIRTALETALAGVQFDTPAAQPSKPNDDA